MANVLGLNQNDFNFKNIEADEITTDILTVNTTVNIPDGSLTISDTAGLQTALDNAGGNETLQVAYNNSSTQPQIELSTNGAIQIKKETTVTNALEILNDSSIKKAHITGEGAIDCTNLTPDSIISSGNIRGDSMTCDNTLTTDFLTCTADINTDNIICTGDINARDITSTRDINGVDLTLTQLLTTDSLTVNTTVNIPAGSLTISDTAGLQTALDTAGGNETLQVAYNNSSQPQIELSSNGALQIEGEQFVVNCLEILDNGGTETLSLSQLGRMTCKDMYTKGDISFINPTNPEASINYDFVEESFNFYSVGNFTTPKQKITASTTTFNNNLVIEGDLTISTDAFIVDIATSRVGIGTASPDSSLHVIGPRQTTPLSKGLHLGHGASSDSYGMEICSAVNNNSVLDFTEEGSDYRGRILYNPSLERFDFSANGALQFVLSSNEANFQNQLIKTTGDLAINTDTLYVDSTNNHVGIGTTTPESTLQIVGARQGVPTTVGVHIGHSSGTNYGLELCSLSTASSGIDFTQPNSNRRGSIGYNNSTNIFTISTNDSQTQLTIEDGLLDAQDCDITTTGNIDANLNSTRGQIMSFLGEESGRLGVNLFDFRYGNGQASAGAFGVCTCGDMKLKKWVYQNNNTSGTAFTTGTLIVFRVWSNGVGTGNYLYCDFSDTSRSNVTRRRCQGRFSSSATSYTPVSNTITDAGDGSQISLQTITLTGPGTTNNDHRINLYVELLEDMD